MTVDSELLDSEELNKCNKKPVNPGITNTVIENNDSMSFFE